MCLVRVTVIRIAMLVSLVLRWENGFMIIFKTFSAKLLITASYHDLKSYVIDDNGDVCYEFPDYPQEVWIPTYGLMILTKNPYT